MTVQEEFLVAIKADPKNVNLRQVYSDWLEENNQSQEAHKQRQIAIGLPYLADFEPYYNCNEGNLTSNKYLVRDFNMLDYVPKEYGHKYTIRCHIDKSIFKLVDLPRPTSTITHTKIANSKLECIDAVALAYASNEVYRDLPNDNNMYDI